jgi:adenine-specific DNA-methyltransferase
MDEVFGDENACSLIAFVKTTGFFSNTLPNVSDYLLWYAKNRSAVKFRQPLFTKVLGGDGSKEYTMAAMSDGTRRPLTKAEKDKPELIPDEARVYRLDNLRSQGGSDEGSLPYQFEGITYPCGSNMHWKTRRDGLDRLAKSLRISGRGEGKTLCYVRYVDDFAAYPVSNV